MHDRCRPFPPQLAVCFLHSPKSIHLGFKNSLNGAYFKLDRRFDAKMKGFNDKFHLTKWGTWSRCQSPYVSTSSLATSKQDGCVVLLLIIFVVGRVQRTILHDIQYMDMHAACTIIYVNTCKYTHPQAVEIRFEGRLRS